MRTFPNFPSSNHLWVAMAKYLESILVQGGSQETWRNRRTNLYQAGLWFEERSVTHPEQITREHCDRYQRHLYHSTNLSQISQQARLIALRVFCKWMYRQQITPSNPSEHIVLPKIRRALPSRLLCHEEVEEVLATLDVQTPIGLRARALLETLYSTGLRRRELVGLCLQDLDLERGSLFVGEGKGKKDRHVPLGKRAAWWLNRWLEEGRPHYTRAESGSFVFLADNGKQMGTHRAGFIAKAALMGSGKDRKGLGCHLFRHSMATEMLERGADIRHLQEILGHADINSTQIYAHVSMRKLKEVHEKCHPAEINNE